MTSKEKVLMKTMTGEHFMLTRIHFSVPDRATVVRMFSRLKCVDFDPEQKRWTWLYGDEAKGLKFEVPYNKVPRESRPIVLGSIFFTSDKAGYLNTNSFERATKFLTFFDQKLRREYMEFTEIEIVNKLIDPSEISPELHRKYFDLTPARTNKAEVAWERMQMIANSPISQERKRELLFQRSTRDAKKTLDLIERLPCNFYEPEGVRSLETALKMREILAVQHWLGKTDFSFYDLLQPMVKQLKPHASDLGC